MINDYARKKKNICMHLGYLTVPQYFEIVLPRPVIAVGVMKQ